MYRRIKPFADLFFAVIFLVLFAPVLLLLLLLVAMQHKGSPFFLQQRIGKDGKPFSIIKFKTIPDCDGDQLANMPEDSRLPFFGRLLRATSLDELPQFINIIKGDMALIGPRPLIHADLAMCTARDFTRHSVRPGITGWAQVNGRNGLEPREKFAYDLWYIENMSFLLDCRILCLTPGKVVTREGL